jgi:hypothetical protein
MNPHDYFGMTDDDRRRIYGHAPAQPQTDRSAFTQSEKDLRPYHETEKRGMFVPLAESGYNGRISPAVPGVLGGGGLQHFHNVVHDKNSPTIDENRDYAFDIGTGAPGIAGVMQGAAWAGKKVFGEGVARAPSLSVDYPAFQRPPEVKPSLPMDQASRMARAKQGGFNLDEILYRGTNGKYANLKPSGDGHLLGPGVYTTPNAFYAQSYGENITPLYARGKIANVEDAPRGFTDLFKTEATRQENASKWARENGYSGIRSNIGAGEVNIFDAANLRHPGAAFDPSKAHLPGLLLANDSRAALPALAGQREGLPMDQASRMQRAKDMGFDAGTTWYHGTPQENLEAIKPGMRDPGAWFTTDLMNANNYAKGGTIHDTHLRAKNPYVVDAADDGAGGFKPMHKGVALDHGDNVAIVRDAFRRGHDAVHFPDGNFSESGNTMVVRDGYQIRSRDATFDPALSSSDNLLAVNRAHAALPGLSLSQQPDIDELLRRFRR